MPLEWTHSLCSAGRQCTEGTDCLNFPTTEDRLAMMEATYQAYTESDGTNKEDFLMDVILWAWAQKFDLFEIANRVGVEVAKKSGS